MDDNLALQRDYYMDAWSEARKEIQRIKDDSEAEREEDWGRWAAYKDEAARLIGELRDENEKLRAACDLAVDFIGDQFEEPDPTTGRAYTLEARPVMEALLEAMYPFKGEDYENVG